MMSLEPPYNDPVLDLIKGRHCVFLKLTFLKIRADLEWNENQFGALAMEEEQDEDHSFYNYLNSSIDCGTTTGSSINYSSQPPTKSSQT